MGITTKKDQLAAARSVLASSGMSPRALGIENTKMVIGMTHRWGYISAKNAILLLQRTSGGYMQKQVRKGDFVETRTASGSPFSIFTLAPQGLQKAERDSRSLCRYPEIDPYNINQNLIRHTLLGQKITINAQNNGVIIDYQTERMIDVDGSQSGIKQPDIVWITTPGLIIETSLRIGVEIELSAKWSRLLDDFILGIIHALQPHNGEPARFDRFIICSDSRAIITRYQSAMQPGATLSSWEKNQRGHWVVEETFTVPDWLTTKVDFRFVGE